MKIQKKMRAGVLGLCCILLCLFATGIPVFASSTEEESVSEADQAGVSLYETQTALTAYVNNVIGVNGNEKHDKHRVENPETVGNAGAYVGYGDKEKGCYDFVTSTLTYGVSSSTYDSWQNVTEGDSPVYAYVRFGHMLSDAGLDVVAGDGFSLNRALYGGVSLLLYCLAVLVPEMFGFALTILRTLNPFQFLSHTTVLSAYWKDAFPTGTMAIFTPIIDFVSHFYDVICNDLTWTAVVPVLIAVVAFQILMLRRPAGSQLANLLKRIVFFAIGIPLCAGLYTGTINRMQDVFTKDISVGQIVAGTLVDFESWASNSQLAVPDGVYLESAPTDDLDETSTESVDVSGESEEIDSGVASAETLRNLRTTAYAINRENNDALSGMPSVWNEEHFMWSGNVWDDNASVTNANDNVAFEGLSNVRENLHQQSGILEMMARYLSGSFYRPSDFQTSFSNELATRWRSEMGHRISTGSATSNRGTVYEMFDRTDTVDDWMNREEKENGFIWAGKLDPDRDGGYYRPEGMNRENDIWVKNEDSYLTWVDKEWNIYSGGSLTVSSTDADAMMQYTTPGEFGLSTQAMYNYLSTAFDDNSVLVYSPDNSVSEMTKQQHYAINSVGTGALNFAFGLNMLVIMLVLVLIGFVFSVNMVLHNIKRGFSLLMSIPLAMVGVVKAIAQVISYTVALILELIICMFLYLFISDLVVLVATVLEGIASGSVLESGSVTVSVQLHILDAFQMTGSEWQIVLLVILETLLTAGLFAVLFAYRRMWLRIRKRGVDLLYQGMTLPEFQEMYEEVIRTGAPLQHQPSGWAEVLVYLRGSSFRYQLE